MGIKQGDKWTFWHVYRGTSLLFLISYIVFYMWGYSEQGKDVYAGMGSALVAGAIAAFAVIFFLIGSVHVIISANKGRPVRYNAISLFIFSLPPIFVIAFYVLRYAY